MTNEALMQYMLVVAGIGEILQKLPTGKPAPLMTNVNVSTWPDYPTDATSPVPRYCCLISGVHTGRWYRDKHHLRFLNSTVSTSQL